MVTGTLGTERATSLHKLMLKLVGRPTPRATRTPRDHLEADLLTRTEIHAVIEHCPLATWTGARNRTLIVVLWRTGLRISEALALREKDVDLVEARLVVQRGKGGRRRVLGLDQGTIGALEEWLKRRAEIAPTVATPLFSTQHGGPIDPSYIRRLLPRLARCRRRPEAAPRSRAPSPLCNGTPGRGRPTLDDPRSTWSQLARDDRHVSSAPGCR